jgi:hypothetical protein
MRDTTIEPITVSRDLEESAAPALRPEVDEGHRQDGVTARQAQRPSARMAPVRSRVVEMMDRTVARLLRVQLQPLVPREAVVTSSSRPFETPLLIAGVRCTLRYIVLPFVLPLIAAATGATLSSIATGAALGLVLTLDVIAAVAIVATLRRLWRLQHSRRWQYLAMAVALAALIGLFFIRDARVLIG